MIAHASVPYFFYAFGILLREGLEAMLVIIALAAGARNAGGRDRSRDVYAGALLAVVASALLEGVFQFLAAATLFYVSSWLTAKGQSDRWNRFISGKVQVAERSALPALALGATAFVAVIREGAETIVFFQALAAGATQGLERHAIFAGIIAATLALGLVFWILTRAAYRV